MTEETNSRNRLERTSEMLRQLALTLQETNRLMARVVRVQAEGTRRMLRASAAAKAGVAGLQRQDALLRFAQAHLTEDVIDPAVQYAIDKAVAMPEDIA